MEHRGLRNAIKFSVSRIGVRLKQTFEVACSLLLLSPIQRKREEDAFCTFLTEVVVVHVSEF